MVDGVAFFSQTLHCSPGAVPRTPLQEHAVSSLPSKEHESPILPWKGLHGVWANSAPIPGHPTAHKPPVAPCSRFITLGASKRS